MKKFLVAFAILIFSLPAFAFEVQITDDKTITLIPMSPHKVNKVQDDWADMWCRIWGICEEPAPTPDPAGEKDYSKGITPLAHDLQMSGVPVLDQGQYGTCVTFAATAALDALLVKGDFVSQQCSLAFNLGQGNNYWNGAYKISEIIDPIKQYGVVSKSSCTKPYADRNQKLTVAEYQALVDKTVDVSKVTIVYKATADIATVKRALDAGHRVAIGFLLDGGSSEAVRGFDILYSGQKYKGGLWACKQGSSVNHCVKSNAGHEIVIVGYDDAQKLFKIRNSWSQTVGAQGDYFMSYEFFSKMAIDMSEIW